MPPLSNAAVPSFKQFMLQSKVRSLYRSVLREARLYMRHDASQRLETVQFARREIELQRHVQDPAYIRALLRDGVRQLEKLQQMRNMTQ
jgi:hypothetical protein